MDPLNTLLQKLAKRGLTQTEVAAAIGVSPQYLSDVKRGRRPLTELIARRLSEKFHVDLACLWEQGLGATAGGLPRRRREIGLWLPVLSHPIDGAPQTHPRGEGVFIPITASTIPKLLTAREPYILRFRHNDVDGRLHRNDLVLVSQTPNESAQIVVVRTGKKRFLCRRKSRRWLRLTTGQPITGECDVIGHCIAVVWSALD